MKKKVSIGITPVLIVALLTILSVLGGCVQQGQGGKSAPQLTIYMQMGGNEGDPSTLARTNGARAAAEALNIKLIAQYSGWQPEKMIAQFKEAVAARPDGIVIMGHPGEGAFEALVEDAVKKGIIITSNNNPLPGLEKKYQPDGFGYAGAQLYSGGYLTGTAMLRAGLKAGDKALVYDLWSQEGRSKSPQGIYDALTEAGLIVEKMDISPEVDAEASACVPVLTAYLQKNPGLKAIGTQHGNVTSQLMNVLKAAGKKPGDVVVGGIDLSPATIEGIEKGYVSASFDQVLYLQGFFPVQQIWLTKNYKIPGLHIDTGVGTVTPENISVLKPLIEEGVR
ncbi:MAG: substrate-binding domain-containing protein [Spirochaetales bacterium]|nr:substrate-binding domain-containing protein [Spirochaetales bacterium]